MAAAPRYITPGSRHAWTGGAVLALIRGLRGFLETGTIDDLPAAQRLEFASRCLPYAAVLGLTDRWAAQIAGADDDETSDEPIGWYGGPAGWQLSNAADSIGNLVAALNGSLVSGRQLLGAGAGAGRVQQG